jgi:hypothetical protein
MTPQGSSTTLFTFMLTEVTRKGGMQRHSLIDFQVAVEAHHIDA